LYFKRIDMHGFKSFAEPVSIEFTDGITCIVGPNGSGKSNISDAIRWALGEQSPKTLRGGKMEEVIFAGTAQRKSRGMAEVTLVIDNSKGILPIDYNEVAITRRMYRSGESEYYINNNQCRLRDIRELIMDTGIGVDGYSLIGQGKIADIVSNKPESRREVFEEAAGIVMYRSKKADSEKKLESSMANLERVGDIIAEIESRIDGLKEDSEKAAEYVGLRKRYKELEINITLKNIESIELKNEYIADDIMEAENSINEIKEQKSLLDSNVRVAGEKTEELDRLSGIAQARLLNSVEEINSIVNSSQLSAEKLSRFEKDESRLTEEIAALAVKLAREEADSEELLRKKSEIGVEVKRLADELQRKTENHAEAAGNLTGAASAIDDMKNALFRFHNDISVKKGEINSLENLKGALEKRKQQLFSERQDQERAEKEFREGIERAAGEIAEKKEALGMTLAEREALLTKYNEFTLGGKKLTGELEELKVSIGQLSARQKTIEEMESNYEGYNGAVRFIMKSGTKGINGVVAELIKVPKGFETAVETALGAALQNIVCENDDAAQKAIGLLKENKAGRLTFLPVDSIKSSPYAEKSLKGERGFKGFGVDCISFDSKYRGVMNYLLGRVAVVETLEDAVRMSKSAAGGFRFVSLEGEIINASGAITGGAYKNRTANLLERKGEIATLKERIQEKIDERAKIEERIESLLTQIEAIRAETLSADEKIRTVEVELLKQENELNGLTNMVAECGNNTQKSGKELESIDDEQSGADKMIGGLIDSISLLEEEIESTEKSLEKTLVIHDDLKIELENAGEEITKARIAASACESEMENAEALALRIRGDIDEMSIEKQKKEDEISEIAKERRALLSGGTGFAEDLAKKEEEKASIEKYLDELSEEKAAASKQLTDSALEKDAMEEKLAAHQSQKHELEIKKAKFETQLDNYKGKLWEEFEVSYIQAIEFRKKNFLMPAALKESREIKNRMKELGEVNVGAIKEYETVSERYSFLTEQRADILEAMGALKQIIDDMDRTIREKFKESFDKVVENFSEVFMALFGGGYAELRLEDETKPLESGIEIIAQPPGKKLQNINLMSGGEKTMTAIALMFAILKTKPTPFCILDEIEASLDDSNIDRFSSYLKSFERIQFTLVTHQKATMEHADVLYGVTMPEQGISKVVSLKLGDEFEM